MNSQNWNESADNANVSLGNSTLRELEDTTKLFGRDFPEWAAILYFTFVSFGGLLDVCLIIGLMKCKSKGIILILIQLLLVDVLGILLLIPEILLLRHGSWIFPSNFCPVFLGGEITINCLAIYLMVCLNFHVISIWNLHYYEASQGKNPLTSCDEDDSNECLVKKNETPTTSRNLTIDYRKKKTDVNIIFPSLLIWSVCVSLGVPQYALSTTLKLKIDDLNSTLCTVINTPYEEVLQNTLLSFKTVVPLILLFVSFVVLLVKLYRSRIRLNVGNGLSKNMKTSQSLIVFCVMLSLTCFLTFLPRNVPYVMHTLTNNKTISDIESFKIPPLHNIYISEYQAVFLAMFHYGSIPVRTIICMTFLPTLRKFFRQKIFSCFKKEEKS